MISKHAVDPAIGVIDVHVPVAGAVAIPRVVEPEEIRISYREVERPSAKVHDGVDRYDPHRGVEPRAVDVDLLIPIVD